MAGAFIEDTFAVPSIFVSDPAGQVPRDECVFPDAASVREIASKRWSAPCSAPACETISGSVCVFPVLGILPSHSCRLFQVVGSTDCPQRSLADGWNAHRLTRLKNKEVLDILNRAGALGFEPLGEVVTSALSGQLILYDRSTVKHFR